MVPCALANEAAHTAEMLRFCQKTVCHPAYGIPLPFTTRFEPRLNKAFPAQCQYIASLYHYVATTGDLDPGARAAAHLCCSPRPLPARRSARHRPGGGRPRCGRTSRRRWGRTAMTSARSTTRCSTRACAPWSTWPRWGDGAGGECRAWAARLRASFVKYLYDEEQGYFISSCSSRTAPRSTTCCQAVFWITPFARELVAHAPARIAAFMDEHLRSAKCLLSLPAGTRPGWPTATSSAPASRPPTTSTSTSTS